MSPLKFIAISLQFALLVLVIRSFELVSPNFGSLVLLAWCGFIVNHFLPQKLRMPWFVLVSLWGLKLVAGGTVAVWVTVCGIALIGICHLPVPFWARVTILFAAAAGISLLRVGHVVAPVNVAAWIVLGSMFMFRTMSYLYELRHRTAPFDPVRALAYFFMLPNVCFTLFPLVDYRTFCSSHFSESPEVLYPRGLRWMLRGVMHLLLYRLVYQLVLINPLEATDLLSVVRFMLSTYLLYLRVSGWFHLIVGLLLMYGFNMPETHHLYYLASSFTDFWRRINIYWKDFLLKVFFYPAYFRLKPLGPTWAMAIATLYAFFITWLLHSYQFFWIRGEWLLTWQDSLFWALLAALVLANALWELRAGRRRSLGAPKRTWKSDSTLALKTIGTFVVICALWTLWSCKTWEELTCLGHAARTAPLYQIALVVLGMLAIGVLGAWLGHTTAEGADRIDATTSGPSFWASAGIVSASGLLLLAVAAIPTSSLYGRPALREALLAVQTDQLNRIDLANKRRGYYEDLDANRLGEGIWFLHSKWNPTKWVDDTGVSRDTNGFVRRQLVPSKSARFYGGNVTSNRWGMRDQDYELKKPPGAYRVTIHGSSHEWGSGVRDEAVFERIVEDRINASPPDPSISRYEILNFAVYGHSLYERLYTLENQASSFEPDAVLFVVNSNEEENLLAHLSTNLKKQRECPYPRITEIELEAKVTSDMSRELIEARLRPHVQKLTHSCLTEFSQICRSRGFRPCIVFRPSPVAATGPEQERELRFVEELRTVTTQIGVPLFDLSGAFGGIDPSDLIVGPDDDHCNERAHQLLAEKLCQIMTSPEGRSAWLGPHSSKLAHQSTDPEINN